MNLRETCKKLREALPKAGKEKKELETFQKEYLPIVAKLEEEKLRLHEAAGRYITVKNEFKRKIKVLEKEVEDWDKKYVELEDSKRYMYDEYEKKSTTCQRTCMSLSMSGMSEEVCSNSSWKKTKPSSSP